VSQFFSIHPDNPQARLVTQAVEILRKGGVIAYPTDSCYALGCQLGNKDAVERITRIRGFDGKHNYTLVCADFSELATYAKVDNQQFRLLKQLTPGPYTFILPATREVPRRLQQAKRKTIGLRVPDNAIAKALVQEMGEPIMSASLMLPSDEQPLFDAWEIRERLEHHVDLVIEGGYCGLEPTTVVDLSDDNVEVIRKGLGDTSLFE
jgi:tRNA threonylcarbamoyl adenosine modification protein (Sua5/YciO/YrdC/YwlC family)